MRLLDQSGATTIPCLVLKSVDFNPQQRYGTLDELLVAEGIEATSPRHPGRAGKRSANLLAFVRHLHALGNASASDNITVPSVEAGHGLQSALTSVSIVVTLNLFLSWPSRGTDGTY